MLQNLQGINTRKKNLRSALGKIIALWNKIGQSISASEKRQGHFDVALPIPCATKWNTYYDCVTAKQQ